MKYLNEKLAWNVRNGIYILGICAFVVSAFIGVLKAEEAFWPPDMVPHPNPPWDQPKDNDEGDLA
jgi:hypothetical protein